MAIALFKHHFVGKSAQPEPYKTAAHARYIMRRSAAMRVFSENMPRQWQAVQRFLKEHEDGLRKNGRVADTFIIAIPREFTPDAAEKVLRAYGKRIGKGKAPFLVAFHWEEGNPHAHMIFIDRDPETGRRVFGTTEKGSTDLLKIEWQDEVNAMFANLGMDTEIQFGGKLEAQAMNDNEVSEPSPTPTPVVEEPTLQQLAEDAADLGRVDYEEELQAELERRGITEADLPDPYAGIEQEADLADIPEVDDTYVDSPRVEQEGMDQRQRYKLAAEAVQELRRIRTLLREREQIKLNFQGAEAAYEKALAKAIAARAELADAGLAATAARDTYINEHIGVFGKKGFQVSAFGFKYQSPARKAADAAELAFKQAAERANTATEHVQNQAAALELYTKDYKTARARYEAIQGTDEELSEAELIFEATVNEHAGDLNPTKTRDAVMAAEMDEEDAALILSELGYTEEAKQYQRGGNSY